MSYFKEVESRLIDSNNVAFGVDRIDSSVVVFTKPFECAISQNKVPGYKSFRTFGERSNIQIVSGGSDIWEGVNSSIPIPPGIGERMTLVSTSTTDSVLGSGVRSVSIEYLDALGNEQIEIVELNGTTPVNTIATNIRYVQRIQTYSLGTPYTTAAGVISIYRFGVPATVYSVITAGGNRSLTCSLMIPLGKSFQLTRWSVSVTAGKPVSMRLRATQDNGTTTDFFLFQDSCFLDSGTYSHNFDIPLVFKEFTIIKITAYATQAGALASGEFSGFLSPLGL